MWPGLLVSKITSVTASLGVWEYAGEEKANCCINRERWQLEKKASMASWIGSGVSTACSEKSAFGTNDTNAVAPGAASILLLPFSAPGWRNGIAVARTVAHVGPSRAEGLLGIHLSDACSAAVSAGVGLDYQ